MLTTRQAAKMVESVMEVALDFWGDDPTLGLCSSSAGSIPAAR